MVEAIRHIFLKVAKILQWWIGRNEEATSKMNFRNDESGDWQHFGEPSPRYGRLHTLIDGFCPNCSVLDIGCGKAVLRDYLAALSCRTMARESGL